MKIAICDDLKDDREKIKKMLLKLSEEVCISFEIEEFENGEELFNKMKSNKFHIVLLDIYMDGQKGIDTARYIKEIFPETIIIFTTTSPDYAIESYSLNVEGYLVKPIKYELFRHCALKYVQAIKSSYKYIKIENNKMMINVLINNIIYLETYSKQTIIHTFDRSIDTRLSSSEINSLLKEEYLYKVTRNFIINFNFVDYIENNKFVLTTGEKISMPRRTKTECKEAYSNYFWKTIKK